MTLKPDTNVFSGNFIFPEFMDSILLLRRNRTNDEGEKNKGKEYCVHSSVNIFSRNAGEAKKFHA